MICLTGFPRPDSKWSLTDPGIILGCSEGPWAPQRYVSLFTKGEMLNQSGSLGGQIINAEHFLIFM